MSIFAPIGVVIHNLVYEPVFNLMIIVYKTVGNFGIAILLIALIAKIVTYPLTRKQINSAQENKEFQRKIKEVKAKYKDDETEQAKEMAKLQAQYLPGQLSGCFNIIVSIVLLFQIRGVVLDIFSKGVHSFNEVAYVDSMKFVEDKITLDLPDDFAQGTHNIKYKLYSENGNEFEVTMHFGVAQSTDGVEEVKKGVEQQVKDSNQGGKLLGKGKAEGNDIALYIPQFDPSNVLTSTPQDVTAYIRPPSGQLIDYSKLEVSVDDKVVAPEQLITQSGERLDLTFLGMDLSKVAADFGLKDSRAWPLIALGIAVGITQFFATRIQTGEMGVATEDKKDKDDKKEDPKSKNTEEEPDFAEIMAESSKRAAYIFPVFTALLSMGYMGGGGLFPAGVSLFWTAQNASVIIQQLISGFMPSQAAKTEEIATSEEVKTAESTSSKKKKKKKKKKK